MLTNSDLGYPFVRYLPGGGFVAIEVTRVKSNWRQTRFLGRIIVERRARSRRDGHIPPVIARASGATVDDVVSQLFSAAQSNGWIAAALLRLGGRTAAKRPVGPLGAA